MTSISYQDWVTKPGEDPVFVLARLFRALHGLMRSSGVELVIVPFHLNDLFKPSLEHKKGPPQGLRVYFAEKDETAYEEHLHLSVMLLDALRRKAIKPADPQRVQGKVRMRRLRTKSEPSSLRRFAQRNPDKDATGKLTHWHQERKRRPGHHLWLLREDGQKKIPFFYQVEVEKDEEMAPEMIATNTYGCGEAPLVDFFL